MSPKDNPRKLQQVDAVDRPRYCAIHALPPELTSFIGRERERAQVKQLLSLSRVVTLTGAGGCGKTRLALRVAADLRDDYADGVYWVELAPLSDATLLPQAIAKALNAVEQSGRALLDVLLDWLYDKRLLLVLDNCEHLASACAEFAQAALSDAPDVSILATSREPLAVTGEMLYPVTPLALPPKSRVGDLASFDSIRLFLERAQSILPSFALTPANAPVVADICRRLDGIPLAIELASARVTALTVEQIAARLDDRFALLTAARHGMPSHHRTLRAALDWSYSSLSAQERILLRRLSAFAGGCTLDAVEQVCAGDGIAADQIVDGLSSLVNKSLVVAETLQPGEARYRMLETIRQYAGEKLTELGEAERLRDRHLDCYLKSAEEAERKLDGAEQLTWLNRVEREHDNVRLALEWSLRHNRIEKGLRLAGALYSFWYIRGYWSETYQKLLELLNNPGAADRTLARGKALRAAGQLAMQLGYFEDSRTLFEESIGILRGIGDAGRTLLELALARYAMGLHFADPQAARGYAEEGLQLSRESGNELGTALSLSALGLVAVDVGDFGAAQKYLAESAKKKRGLGDKSNYARAVCVLGMFYLYQGNLEQAKVYLDESLTLSREIGDQWNLDLGIVLLARIAWLRGQYDEAESRLAQAIFELRELGDKRITSMALMLLGLVHLAKGNHALAQQHLREALSLAREADARIYIPATLKSFAFLFATSKKPLHAARLFGAAQALREKLSAPLRPIERTEYERYVTAARAQLDEAAFSAAWEEGCAMTMEQAIAEAERDTVTQSPAPVPTLPRDPNALTPREIEVLRLVAAGLSDAQVAMKLVIGRRTVSTHLTAIYGKLGVNSRSAATRYALDQKLI